MEPLIIHSKESTPYVNFDNKSGIMELRGVSYDEDSFSFYKQIYDWIDQYKQSPRDISVININLAYFNTSSAKCIFDLLDRFVRLNKMGFQATINWYYTPEDDNMKDEILNFQDILEYPINIIELKPKE
jgi:hypothetical protein